MMNKAEIKILIGIVEKYRGLNFKNLIHKLVEEHHILAKFESYTSFDEILAKLCSEKDIIDQAEERERIQNAYDEVDKIYFQYKDKIESTISKNKMDALISVIFERNTDPNEFYSFLSKELKDLDKSETPEKKPIQNVKRSTSLHH